MTPGPDEIERPTKIVLIATVAMSMACALAYSNSTPLDPDELEHLHAAWLWGQGLHPYREFFEPHPPLFFLLLRPLFATVADRDVVGLLHHARWLGWLIATTTIAGGFRFYRAALGERAAWFGGALLACFFALTPHAVQVRADMLALTLVAFGSALTLEGLGLAHPEGEREHSLVRVFFGGVLMAASVCALPKTLFWTFATFLAVALAAMRREDPDRPTRASLVALVAGALMPFATQLAWVFLANDPGAFWRCIVVANGHWTGVVLKYPQWLAAVTRTAFSWPVLATPLALIGLAESLGASGAGAFARKTTLCLVLAAAVALILLGAPWPQYQVPLVVMIIGLSGAGLSVSMRALPVHAARGVTAGLAVLVAVWLVMYVAIPATSNTPGMLSDLQAALARSAKDDTYVGITHWNPVFLKDADPMLFSVYDFYGDKGSYERVLQTIRERRPRFVVGLGTTMFLNGKVVHVQLLRQEDATLLSTYTPLAPPSLFILERQPLPTR